MDKAVYESMARVEREHWWFKGRRNIVLEAITRHVGAPVGRILDVGCGTGAMSEALTSLGEVWACDSSPEALKHVVSSPLLKAMDASSLLAAPSHRESFDLITFFDVIEHFADDGDLLRRYLDLLKPGGTVVITVPAFALFWGHHDVVSGHHRRYTMGSLESLAREAGLVPLRSFYFNSLLSPLVLAARVLGRMRAAKPSDGDLSLPHPLLNHLLYSIFSAERWVGRIVPFPLGAFLISIVKKS